MRDQLTSPEYRAVLQNMHTREVWGNKGHKHIERFIPFFDKLKCETLLDYGCGTASLHDALAPDIDVQCYDPGVFRYDRLPDPADFVVCTDVLEHIEPELLDGVLTHLSTVTLKGGYFNIALTKAKRDLPDGRNAHLIIQPAAWWLNKLRVPELRWRIDKMQIGQKSLKVWMRKT